MSMPSRRSPDNYNLKVIYDAAHAFGVQTDTPAVCCSTATSRCSASTPPRSSIPFEGGAIICPDAKTKQRIDHLKNFGHVDEVTVVAPGINGKMSEINAAFGLLQLKHIDVALARRKEIDARYRELLRGHAGHSLRGRTPAKRPRTTRTSRSSSRMTIRSREMGCTRNSASTR